MAAALRTALCLAFITTLVSGCAATDDVDGEDDVETAEAQSELNGHRRRRTKAGPGGARPRPWAHGHRGHKKTIPVTAPTGNSFIAEVTANGTGCPEGSWDAAISDDGETFTLRMNEYEATLEPNQDRSTKDCRVSVKLTSPEGLAYSVASFFYSGYVFLDQEGMRGTYAAKYSFREDPRSMRTAERDITRGPTDQEFVFASDPRPVWSPCGGTSTLNIDTRITVINNRRKTGSAFMNNSAVDGAIGNNDGSLAMKWRLGWRRC